MNIGAAITIYNLASQLDTLDHYHAYAERLGYDAMEFNFSSQGHRPPYAALPFPWEDSHVWTEVRHRVGRYAMPGVHLPHIDINPLSEEPEIAARALFQYRSAIDRAAEMGMRYGVIHMIGYRKHTTRQTWLPLWVEHMGEMAEHASKADFALCLENAAYGFFLDDVAYLLRQVNSPYLRMTLDTGHAQLSFSKTSLLQGIPYGAYGSMESFIEQDGDLLLTLHIHDNMGQDDDHLVIGEGVGDFGYLRLLRENGFAGAWTFEHSIGNDWDSLEVATRRLQSIAGGP